MSESTDNQNSMDQQPEIWDPKPLFVSDLFKDQVIIITGGALGGIGSATALQLSKLSPKGIAICGRRIEPLEKTAEMLKKESPNVEVYYATCDIRDNNSVETFVKNVLSKFGQIDVLINNAGGQYPQPAEFLTEKGFTAVIRNNLIGTFLMTSACARLAFIPQKRGRVVNVIAQIARGFPGMAHTGAARAGVDNLTKSLAIEWAPHNIKVNSVAPGVVLSTGTARYPPELLAKSRQATPLQRFASVGEIGHLIMYLASERAAGFVTGQTYYIDGGHSLSGDIFNSKPSAKL